MVSRVMRFVVLSIMVVSLSGCNLPFFQSNANGGETDNAPSGIEVGSGQGSATENGADFNPLALDCIVGTWEVDLPSLLYAANALISSPSIQLTKVGPSIIFRFAWADPSEGSTYTMQAFYQNVLINAVIRSGDQDHLLEMVLNGVTAANFSAGPTPGQFEYTNIPEGTDMAMSGLKMDGTELGAGVVTLNDLIGSVSGSTMLYTCQSIDTITLQDISGVEPFSLHRVSEDAITR